VAVGAGRKAAGFYPADGRTSAPPPAVSVGRVREPQTYTARSLTVKRGIRAAAWIVVSAGVAAPALRRALKLRPAAVLLPAATAPAALCVLARPSRIRNAGVCVLNMWAYLAAYEMPHDDPERLAARVRVTYPIVLDRLIGLGVPPTLRLQRAFSSPGHVNGFERVLVWCHWMWFFVPHGATGYVLLRDQKRFPAAAARMYAVFDLGAVFYWAIPTAPPWWAAAHGHLEDGEAIRIRRMMIEYGEQFWGERWGGLYDVLGGNPLAAMPSLHFATSLMAAHLLSEVGPIAGAVAWTYTALLGLALVYLGEHYAADIIGGAVLAEAVRMQAPRFAAPGRGIARTLLTLGA
jgi:membrane-associated phospholipid phosphatase